ncbi:MAG: mannitol dehydrogenase family protein [Pseudomonadota bacterium]
MSIAVRLKRHGTPPKIGIVHFGPGAFFRAFNAVYTHEAMARSGGDWGILAVSLKSSTARDQLLPQGCVYTSVTRAQSGNRHGIITSVADVKVAPDHPIAVLDVMTNPAVKIVSLTITEKGYCHEPSTGRLNLAHPDIVHDLAHPDAPRTAIGFIVAALARRRHKGHCGFTVLSCDNLPANGKLVRGVVLEFAGLVDVELANWIERNTSFPSTMVDRITPATTPADVADLDAETGYHDPACVVHEAFRQWVIEDDFVGGRPAWEAAGAQYVTSVDAHETMKLRCLNGTHSTLAYLGYLAGHETISDCVADPDFASLCEKLWHHEIIPTLQQPDGEDLKVYCARLLERYRDTAIRHRTWQIAMDGSQKLPQRILGTIADNLVEGIVPSGLCLVVAAWMRYIGGLDEKGGAIDVRDPLADRLKQVNDEASDKVVALLAMEELFPGSLATDPRFGAAVAAAYQQLIDVGAKASVREYVSA